MGIPIARLQKEITSYEFAEYWAYYKLHPLGELKRDYRAGVIASIIANMGAALGGKKKDYKPQDFFPSLKGERVEQSSEEQLEQMEIINKAFGGKDLRNKE